MWPISKFRRLDSLCVKIWQQQWTSKKGAQGFMPESWALFAPY